MVASLATLLLAVQVLVVEPTADAAGRAARDAAAREASLAAAVVRAGGAPTGGAVLRARAVRPTRAGGIATVGDGRLVWVPVHRTVQIASELRVRLAGLVVCGVLAVVGWALWAGIVRRRHADRAARDQLEMIGMVAHDLRGPLTGIALAADRLANATVPAARVAARAAIDRECARLLATSEDILSVCCDAADERDRGVDQSISDVLEDVATRIRQVHGCAVVVDAELDARRLRADCQLARAVANVAENAARHTPPGSAVYLRAAADAAAVEVVVEDAGAGFAPGFSIRAFCRGLRGGRAGLGLASSRRVVERLDGSLRVGERYGGGASVSLRVPRRGLPQ
ncbi:MAG: ATP-binding protein [Gaiellales bacterium]